MSVLKYEEYIKEGLWTKGIERSKTDDKRIGDKEPFDIISDKIKSFISETYGDDIDKITCTFTIDNDHQDDNCIYYKFNFSVKSKIYTSETYTYSNVTLDTEYKIVSKICDSLYNIVYVNRHKPSLKIRNIYDSIFQFLITEYNIKCYNNFKK